MRKFCEDDGSKGIEKKQLVGKSLVAQLGCISWSFLMRDPGFIEKRSNLYMEVYWKLCKYLLY